MNANLSVGMGQPSAGSDAVPGKHKGGLDDREWNALIGIVTALIGNVLISFALNIQRYAHIRLHRERLLHKKSWSNGKLRGSAYGTVDSDRDDHTRNHAEPTNESTPLHRLGSNSEESNEEAMNKSYLRSPWWWAGIILMTVGEGGNFLA